MLDDTFDRESEKYIKKQMFHRWDEFFVVRKPYVLFASSLQYVEIWTAKRNLLSTAGTLKQYRKLFLSFRLNKLWNNISLLINQVLSEQVYEKTLGVFQ